MKKTLAALAATLFLLVCVQSASAQGRTWLRTVNIKSCAFGWDVKTANLALETETGKYFSASAHLMRNKLFMYVMPEFRYWPLTSLDGPFVGLHYMHVWDNDYAGSSFPHLKPQGTASYGLGVSGGYRYTLPGVFSFLAIEAYAGAGLYDRWVYSPLSVMNRKGYDFKSGSYLAIDQLGISLIVTIGKRYTDAL